MRAERGMPAEGLRPVSILIAALGGQGGGVLTEWIVGAAAQAGYPCQATSIPGVAQRTGATTYYIEVFPARLRPDAHEPVFSLYPTPGDLDAIVASELLEAGRTLETDYASPDRTTLLASTHRLFAIGEKTVPGDGVFPRERLEAALGALTQRAILFDALDAARRVQSEVNAVLLGALAATGILPMPPAAFEAAIRQGRVAVDRNLAGFRAGIEAIAAAAEPSAPLASARPWAEVQAEQARALGRLGPSFLALAARAAAEFPPALHPTLDEALARLIDYQDARHAEGFLDRVRAVRAAHGGTRLTQVFARRLAVWMSYEDAIRVADLKTRRSRFARIRAEQAAPDGATLHVTDYLKPDLDELYGILPATLGGPIARWAERRWPAGRPALGQHVRTTTVLGFLRVWLLARLRVLRPRSLRFQRESAVMDRWQRAVAECAAVDEGLACEVAELATVVRGYGAVRRRLTAAFLRCLDEVVTPALGQARTGAGARAHAAARIRAAREHLLTEDEPAAPAPDHGGNLPTERLPAPQRGDAGQEPP